MIYILDQDVRTHASAIAAETGLPATAPDEAEVLLALAPAVTQGVIDSMPRLRFIQALTTGIDQLERLRIAPQVKIANARGVHGPQMSELAILMMLSLARCFPAMLRNQEARRWHRWPQPLLEGKTAVLLGVGVISEALALRCKAFGMRVVGVSNGRTAVPHFDAIMPRSALAEAAAQADFLIVLVPYTAETWHLVDATILAALRRDSYLINIARGGVVDEAALIDVLRAERIAGAGLDVFETEPLPAASPLWGMKNVIATPHIGGMSDHYAEQVLPLVVHNLRAYAAGDFKAMRNIVRRPGEHA